MTRLIDADAQREKWLCLIGDFKASDFVYSIDIAPTIDAVPVVMIEGRINDLKKMLIDIDSDEVDNIWVLRTKIDALTELLEMWVERKEDRE